MAMAPLSAEFTGRAGLTLDNHKGVAGAELKSKEPTFIGGPFTRK